MTFAKSLMPVLLLTPSLLACDPAPSDAPLPAPDGRGKGDYVAGGAQGADLAIQCWDGTFLYNAVTAVGDDAGIEVIVEGGLLDVVKLDENDWQPSALIMEFHADACLTSDDGKLFRCDAFDLPVTVEQFLDDPQEVNGTLSRVVVELSHVVRTTASGVTEAYELDLQTQNDNFESAHTEYTFGTELQGFPGPGCIYDESSFAWSSGSR